MPPGPRDERHVFIETVGAVSFFHYDPYAQLLSKIVRGFRQELEDAARLIEDGMVDVRRFEELVPAIADESYSRYPSLSRSAVEAAVRDFLTGDIPL